MSAKETHNFSSMQSKKDLLDTLMAARKLTPDGKEWLTLALDPFHDYSHQVAGYPDADCSQTVVSCYQYQAEVAKPNNVEAGKTWDAHIFNLPITRPDDYGVFNMDAQWNKLFEPNPVINNYQTGPLNITTNAAGKALSPIIPNNVDPPTTTTLPVVDTLDLCTGLSRVIGMGFEITNTTAEIYKQGTITAYRMPQQGNQFQMAVTNNALTFIAPSTGVMWREPPGTVAEANLLKGTRTWGASEGAYATCMQNSIQNQLSMATSKQVVFADISAPGAASIARSSYWQTVGAAATAPNASTIAYPVNQTIPFDTTGIFLTGLSEQSTLCVKLRVYVERAPTWTEPSLAVLASPSAGYDVNALELYAAAVNMLPVAVKVGENAKGDWWRAVLSVLRTAAAPIGMALNPFLPGAAILGGAVQGVLGQIDTSKGKSVSKQVAAQVQQKAQSNAKNSKPPIQKKKK